MNPVSEVTNPAGEARKALLGLASCIFGIALIASGAIAIFKPSPKPKVSRGAEGYNWMVEQMKSPKPDEYATGAARAVVDILRFRGELQALPANGPAQGPPGNSSRRTPPGSP